MKTKNKKDYRVLVAPVSNIVTKVWYDESTLKKCSEKEQQILRNSKNCEYVGKSKQFPMDLLKNI